MKDELVTFETAKLAKEKGFNEVTKRCYSILNNEPDGYPLLETIRHKVSEYGSMSITNKGKNSELKSKIETRYTAPTQSLLQKWLREVHNIHMFTKVYYNSVENKTTYSCDVLRLKDGRVSKSFKLPSYEKVLETALYEGLKLIE